MLQKVNINDILKTSIPLIDVRSPGEYKKGHIHGADNIPLFSDEERAHVGTVYIQQSKEKAYELAYRYIEPKLNEFISQSEQVAPNKEVAVYCWRGGMRSQSFAQHLDSNGFRNVFVINGGYKAFRKHVLQTFDIPFNLNILGGYSGSGKTPVLHQLEKSGFQVIDLEKIACHKGSAFGAIGQPEQPTVEQFENNLFEAWRKLDYTQPIWLEDESINIGGVTIPKNLFNQMLNSPVYFLNIPREERARLLVNEYAGLPTELLAESITRLSKRLGGQITKEALHLLNEKKFYEVALHTLAYYDKAYLKGMRFHNQEKVISIPGNSTNPEENATLILQYYK